MRSHGWDWLSWNRSSWTVEVALPVGVLRLTTQLLYRVLTDFVEPLIFRKYTAKQQNQSFLCKPDHRREQKNRVFFVLLCPTIVDDSIHFFDHLIVVEKLKLSHGHFTIAKWETVEGQFPSLKYLSLAWCRQLECWKMESSHFPCLEQLRLCYLEDLKEIQNLVKFRPWNMWHWNTAANQRWGVRREWWRNRRHHKEKMYALKLQFHLGKGW